MKTDLIRIGNSRGVRIPKPLIEECELGDRVELHVEGDRIVIAPERRARAGWEDRFRVAAQEDAELLLGSGFPNKFDHKEWNW